MMKVKVHGSWKNTNNRFERFREIFKMGILDKYGKKGVELLTMATPVDTGRLASSWSYKIIRNDDSFGIQFCNSDIEGGENVALLVQLGHATSTGYWIEGQDYINPVITPLFQEMAEELWEEVKK